MKPLKIIKAFLPALLLCFAIAGCSNNTEPPEKLIVGGWEHMSQTWCEFNDDNTCIIGGMAGEYEIKDDNSISLSVNGSDDSLDFEWAGSPEQADAEHWFVDEDTLFINGMQYPRAEEEATSADEKSSSSDSDSLESSAESETEGETKA